jgi:hypothetical protein
MQNFTKKSTARREKKPFFPQGKRNEGTRSAEKLFFFTNAQRKD